MNFWPFRLRLLPGRQRPTTDMWVVLILGMPALGLPFFLRPNPSLVNTHTQLLLPPCYFLKLAHIPCPTCGMTTSFAYLAHGKIALATLAHPLGILIYMYLAILVGIILVNMMRRRGMTIELIARLWQVIPVVGLAWVAKLAVWFFA
jgi:hypothetical protein